MQSPVAFAMALGVALAFGMPSGAQGAADCPPGLAKKNPPCVPPGQAKKHGWGPGDVIDDGRGRRVEDPWRYDWGGRGTYVVVDGQVLRIDPDTRAILSIIGAAAELLN